MAKVMLEARRELRPDYDSDLLTVTIWGATYTIAYIPKEVKEISDTLAQAIADEWHKREYGWHRPLPASVVNLLAIAESSMTAHFGEPTSE